jgi:hypothetical protein
VALITMFDKIGSVLVGSILATQDVMADKSFWLILNFMLLFYQIL